MWIKIFNILRLFLNLLSIGRYCASTVVHISQFTINILGIPDGEIVYGFFLNILNFFINSQ